LFILFVYPLCLSSLFILFGLQVNARLPFEGGTNLLGARSEQNRG
jgi:hypothetical protein